MLRNCLEPEQQQPAMTGSQVEKQAFKKGKPYVYVATAGQETVTKHEPGE